MATRRRPNEPTPFTQVVARPVDTSVTPGSAGMPQAPVAPIAPTPVSNQDALDLQNLASSLGQFSRSLADSTPNTSKKPLCSCQFPGTLLFPFTDYNNNFNFSLSLLT